MPIYYESRLAKLDINREEIDRLNKDVEEVIEDEEDISARESTKGKWAELAKLVNGVRSSALTSLELDAWRDTFRGGCRGCGMRSSTTRNPSSHGCGWRG